MCTYVPWVLKIRELWACEGSREKEVANMKKREETKRRSRRSELHEVEGVLPHRNGKEGWKQVIDLKVFCKWVGDQNIRNL